MRLIFTYIESLFYPYATDLASKWFEELSSLYPDIPSYGSPYPNNVTDFDYDERLFTTSDSSKRNQFKRISSIRGDLTFDSARRVQAEVMSRSVPVWTYQFRTPVKTRKHLGVYHAAEIPYGTLRPILPHYITILNGFAGCPSVRTICISRGWPWCHISVNDGSVDQLCLRTGSER